MSRQEYIRDKLHRNLKARIYDFRLINIFMYSKI